MSDQEWNRRVEADEAEADFIRGEGTERANFAELEAEIERLEGINADLYAACKALRKAADDAACMIYSGDLPPILRAIEKADAALAKAEGKDTP